MGSFLGGFLFGAALLMLLTRCASFSGPGELSTPGLEMGPSRVLENRRPAVSLRGDRETVEPDSDAPKFDWPVAESRISRGFLLGKRRPHWGIDLANRKGTPILASEAGVVIYTGNEFRGYGKLVVIEHGEKWASLYAHLNRIDVQEGQRVEAGQEIGQMGRTGNARGTHLHFEIRHNREPVNPQAFLPEGYGVRQSSNFHW